MAVERFDLADPTFDVTSPRVHEARDRDWYVETNWGWAVLRYAEVNALLKDRRFRQGNARWPAQNGIHSGLFSDWWQETLLSLEGDDHSRIRRLLMPAFRNKTIATMRPRFEALANELVDGFAAEGRVEFVFRMPRRLARVGLHAALGFESAAQVVCADAASAGVVDVGVVPSAAGLRYIIDN